MWPRTTAAAEVAAGHSSFGAAVLELLFESAIVGTFGVRARTAAAAEVPAGHCSIGAAVTESLFEAVIVGTPCRYSDGIADKCSAVAAELLVLAALVPWR